MKGKVRVRDRRPGLRVICCIQVFDVRRDGSGQRKEDMRSKEPGASG